MQQRGSYKHGLVVNSLVIIGLLSLAPQPLNASPLAPRLPEAAQAAGSATDIQTCFTLGNVVKREACFGRQSDADIQACERVKPFNCKPYKEMYLAARQLNTLNSQLLTSAREKYAAYQQSDPAYLANLASNTQAADKAWAAYRDAQCALEPLLEGMSRTESGNLAEACRADMTHKRIKSLRDEMLKLKS